MPPTAHVNISSVWSWKRHARGTRTLWEYAPASSMAGSSSTSRPTSPRGPSWTAADDSPLDSAHHRAHPRRRAPPTRNRPMGPGWARRLNGCSLACMTTRSSHSLPVHPGNTGSNPVGVTISSKPGRWAHGIPSEFPVLPRCDDQVAGNSSREPSNPVKRRTHPLSCPSSASSSLVSAAAGSAPNRAVSSTFKVSRRVRTR